MGIRQTSGNIRLVKKTPGGAPLAPASIAKQDTPQVFFGLEPWEEPFRDRINGTGSFSPGDVLAIEHRVRSKKTALLLDWKAIEKNLGRRHSLPVDDVKGYSMSLRSVSSYATTLETALENFIMRRLENDEDRTKFSKIHYLETGGGLQKHPYLEFGLSEMGPYSSGSTTSRLLVRFSIMDGGSVEMNLRRSNGNNLVRTTEYFPLRWENLQKETIGGQGNPKFEFIDATLRALLWSDGDIDLDFPEKSAFRGQFSQFKNL